MVMPVTGASMTYMTWGIKKIRAVITPNALVLMRVYVVEVNVNGDITLLIRDDPATVYHISGNIGDELNLVVWRPRLEPPN